MRNCIILELFLRVHDVYTEIGEINILFFNHLYIAQHITFIHHTTYNLPMSLGTCIIKKIMLFSVIFTFTIITLNTYTCKTFLFFSSVMCSPPDCPQPVMIEGECCRFQCVEPSDGDGGNGSYATDSPTAGMLTMGCCQMYWVFFLRFRTGGLVFFSFFY